MGPLWIPNSLAQPPLWMRQTIVGPMHAVLLTQTSLHPAHHLHPHTHPRPYPHRANPQPVRRRSTCILSRVLAPPLLTAPVQGGPSVRRRSAVGVEGLCLTQSRPSGGHAWMRTKAENGRNVSLRTLPNSTQRGSALDSTLARASGVVMGIHHPLPRFHQSAPLPLSPLLPARTPTRHQRRQWRGGGACGTGGCTSLCATSKGTWSASPPMAAIAGFLPLKPRVSQVCGWMCPFDSVPGVPLASCLGVCVQPIIQKDANGGAGVHAERGGGGASLCVTSGGMWSASPPMAAIAGFSALKPHSSPVCVCVPAFRFLACSLLRAWKCVCKCNQTFIVIPQTMLHTGADDL